MNYDRAKALIEQGRRVDDEITREVEGAVCALADTGCTSAEKRLIELAVAAHHREKTEVSSGLRYAGEMNGRWGVYVDPDFASSPGISSKARKLFAADVGQASPEQMEAMIRAWKQTYSKLAKWVDRVRSGGQPPLSVDEDLFLPVRGPHMQLPLLVYAELWDGRHWLYCPQQELLPHAKRMAAALIMGDYGLPKDTVFVEDFEVVQEELVVASRPDGPAMNARVIMHVFTEMVPPKIVVVGEPTRNSRRQPELLTNDTSFEEDVNALRAQVSRLQNASADAGWSDGPTKPPVGFEAVTIQRSAEGDWLRVDGHSVYPNFLRTVEIAATTVERLLRNDYMRNVLVVRVRGRRGSGYLFNVLGGDRDVRFVLTECDLRSYREQDLLRAVRCYMEDRIVTEC